MDVVVELFYSKGFGATAQILGWQLAGDFFKALVWPMGFVRLAKGKGKTFLLTELSWNVVYLLGVYLLWPSLGIVATGISFLIAFVVQFVLIFGLTYKLIGFRFNQANLNCLAVLFPLLLIAFSIHKLTSPPYSYLLGSATSLAALWFSYHHLKKIIPIDKILLKIGIRK